MKTKNKTKPPTETQITTEPAAPLGEYKIIPLQHVRPDPDQPRKVFNEAKLNELAASIRERGIVQPLVVQLIPALRIKEPDMIEKSWQAVSHRGAVVASGGEEEVRKVIGDQVDHWQIIFGERRWRAAHMAGLKEVPVIVREVTDRDKFVLQFVENHQRENLSALEEAAAFDEQIKKRKETDPAFSPDKLAEELGVSRGTIYGRLKLTRLHGPVRLALENGLIDPSVAGEVAAIPSRADQEEMLSLKGSLEGGQPFSFRDVRDYIARHYVKQLADAPFDVKEDCYFPGGVAPDGDLFPGPCGRCPHRSGNMKDLFPEINNVNVCTSPACFEEKCKAHATKLADGHREKGHQVITADEYFKNRNDYVRDEEPILVGNRYLPASKVMGKNGPKPVLIQKGTAFDEVYLKSAVIEAGKANGFDFTPPPKPKPTPKPAEKPKPSKAETEAEAAKQKEREERERKEVEKAKARLELHRKVALAALAELQKKIENRPVNPKSETEFWRFLFSQQQFWAQMIFFNGHTAVWERRGYKGTPGKMAEKLSYAQMRGLILEQMIVCEFDDGMLRSGEFDEGLLEACKFAGIDLKKLEREIVDQNGELAGMPEKSKVPKKKRGGVKPKARSESEPRLKL